MEDTIKVYHLEGSPRLRSINFNTVFLKNIQKISKCCKFEVCGGVTSEKIFLWRNDSLDPELGFFVDPQKYYKNFKEIKYFFHSHPFGTSKPSKIDLLGSKEVQKPFLIYSILQDNFCFYCPNDNKSIYFCI